MALAFAGAARAGAAGLSDARGGRRRAGRRHCAPRRRRGQGASSAPTTAITFRPPIVDPDDITEFLAAWAEAHTIVQAGTDRAFLGAGRHGWTMPIPIVKTGAGLALRHPAAPGGNARAPHRPQRARGDPGGARLHRRAAGLSRARLERRRRPAVRSARVVDAGQARRPLLGVAARRAGKPARAPILRMPSAGSRTMATCTRSSPRRARMRRGVRKAISGTAA